MKRIYTFIISLFVLGVSFSFVSFNSTSASRLMVGQKVSNVSLLKENNEDLLWINFWAVYDAASRNDNVQFSSIIKKAEENPLTKNYTFKSISVSMDRFESIFEEVIKQDDLNFSEIIRESDGFQSELAKELKLNNKFGNFLIDAQGRLVAKDLSPEELEKVLNEFN